MACIHPPKAIKLLPIRYGRLLKVYYKIYHNCIAAIVNSLCQLSFLVITLSVYETYEVLHFISFIPVYTITVKVLPAIATVYCFNELVAGPCINEPFLLNSLPCSG